MNSAVVVAMDMVTACGPGTDNTWNALRAGRSALAFSDRIPFPSGARRAPLGLVPSVVSGESAVMQMLAPLLAKLRCVIPPDTFVLLATTTSEIERLEQSVTDGKDVSADLESDPGALLKKVCTMCGVAPGGQVISAACASSTIAVARAASLIRSGERDSVLVVGCDAVSEFVVAGFASMSALDPVASRPLDQTRRGLNLGEAAAAVLVMSRSRAESETRPIFGEIAGWGISNDAAHVTRPDPCGAQLARASHIAIKHAGFTPEDMAFISAHGTGTSHNDAMEMAAFKSIFSPRPVFSIKGALGHTLGAAGLVEVIISLRALHEKVVPPTVNLRQADAAAVGWVSNEAVPVPNAKAALTVNAGFGGINASLVLTAGVADARPVHSKRQSSLHSPATDGIGWITSSAYGRILSGEVCDYAGRTTPRLVGSVDALFQRKIENFGRFDPISRMTCYACALALGDAGIEYSPDRRQEIGIIGAGFAGSLEANRVFFADYVHAGRVLARGNLFVYTLPSAPLGEAAIHFGFQGPLFAIIAASAPFSEGLETAQALMEDGDAPAMLVVQAEADCALAAIISPGSPLIGRLATYSGEYPRLSDLIAALAGDPTLASTP